MIRLVEADNRLFEQNECILYDENIWENAREKIYSKIGRASCRERV